MLQTTASRAIGSVSTGHSFTSHAGALDKIRLYTTTTGEARGPDLADADAEAIYQ